MTDTPILPPEAVALLEKRYVGTGLIPDLARSHERLRAMFAEACVRIAKQSDALGQKAERTE